MEQVGDDMLLPQMLGDDGSDMVVGEATITDGARPNRQIGAIVAPPLTATSPHIAVGGEIDLFEGIDKCRAQRFAMTKRPMTEINSVFRCIHGGIIQYRYCYTWAD